jgi:hypothetical protein
MRTNKVIPSKPSVAVVCDGECESWYVQMLRRNESSLGVTLKPELPQKKKLKDLFEKVQDLAKYYDKVFWIVDYDVINSETKIAKKGTETPRQVFKKYVETIKKEHNNVVVIVNNPCLEFWLLLHFEQTGKFFETCEKAGQQLKKYLPNYEKTQKFYTKQDNDIYLQLKPRLATALANANKLKSFSLENPDQAISQMHLFFESNEIKKIFESEVKVHE